MDDLHVIEKEVNDINKKIEELKNEIEVNIIPSACEYMVKEIKKLTGLYATVKYFALTRDFMVHVYGNYNNNDDIDTQVLDKLDCMDLVYDLFDQKLTEIDYNVSVQVYTVEETRTYYPEIYNKYLKDKTVVEPGVS